MPTFAADAEEAYGQMRKVLQSLIATRNAIAYLAGSENDPLVQQMNTVINAVRAKESEMILAYRNLRDNTPAPAVAATPLP